MIRHPIAILCLLTALNFLNYIDRQVVSAVLPKIQEELGFSNFMAGLLATAFLLGYFATSPIFGHLADRGSRRVLVAVGVGLWSLATCASGLATGIYTMVTARAFVGIGEASYATLAPTMIDDIAPMDRKNRYLAIFSLATPVGSALGYLLGGAVGAAHGWRTAFFVAGSPGLLAAALCLFLKEPERTLNQKPQALHQVAGTLFERPLYRRCVVGYTLQTFALGAFSYWAPKFLYAQYNLDLKTANFRFGLLTVLAGILGTFFGGTIADRWARRDIQELRAARPAPTSSSSHPSPEEEETAARASLRLSSLGCLVGAPLAAAAFLAGGATTFFTFCFLAEMFIFLSMSPVNAAILRSAPEELRGSAMALAIFSIHFFGDLWSPPLVGKLADWTSMPTAMMILPLAFALSGFAWMSPRPTPQPATVPPQR